MRSKPVSATTPRSSVGAGTKSTVSDDEPAERRRHEHPVEQLERADDPLPDRENRDDSQKDRDADEVDRLAIVWHRQIAHHEEVDGARGRSGKCRPADLKEIQRGVHQAHIVDEGRVRMKPVNTGSPVASV